MSIDYSDKLENNLGRMLQGYVMPLVDPANTYGIVLPANTAVSINKPEKTIGVVIVAHNYFYLTANDVAPVIPSATEFTAGASMNSPYAIVFPPGIEKLNFIAPAETVITLYFYKG